MVMAITAGENTDEDGDSAVRLGLLTCFGSPAVLDPSCRHGETRIRTVASLTLVSRTPLKFPSMVMARRAAQYPTG